MNRGHRHRFGAAAWPALFAGIPLVTLSPLPCAAQQALTVAAEKRSADDVARELANPNNSLASLTFKNQHRLYAGDLPGAGDQSNYTLVFQPVFPFSLQLSASGGKANLFVRPGISLPHGATPAGGFAIGLATPLRCAIEDPGGTAGKGFEEIPARVRDAACQSMRVLDARCPQCAGSGRSLRLNAPPKRTVRSRQVAAAASGTERTREDH